MAATRSAFSIPLPQHILAAVVSPRIDSCRIAVSLELFHVIEMQKDSVVVVFLKNIITEVQTLTDLIL